MQDAAALEAPDRKPFLTPLVTFVRASVPSPAETSLTIASALLSTLAFPDFDLWPLAWIALVPLLVAVFQAGKPGRAFVLGWIWGAVFFYGSCWWLTYSMIRYGHLRAWVAYLLLTLPVALGAVFPALSCAALTRVTARFGPSASFVVPFIWISLEWTRYAITGEAWNALGYSQAFHPALIQAARFGGVYAVGFLVLTANAAVALVWLCRTTLSIALSLGVLVVLALILIVPVLIRFPYPESRLNLVADVVAVQPNVPMNTLGDDDGTRLLNRHLALSMQGLGRLGEPTAPRLVIWPESPMNFTYTTDPQLRKILADFAIANRTSLLVNSLEPAPNSGGYNSAIMINEEGRQVAQYDKIRLMPFGEYVPLPRWLPGASSVRAIVGEFTPGSSYTLMPLGDLRAGVFICFEAAHPWIARTFTNAGADALINISNDGYLGPTPVMRQHLSNAIFRAVENDRPVLRVTNTGISAYISPNGQVTDQTPGFQEAVRSWRVFGNKTSRTFYTRYGDAFVYVCLLITLGFVGASFVRNKQASR